MSSLSTIAFALWKTYGYELPDTPSAMAHKVLFALDKAGYVVENKKDGPLPKE